MTRAIHKPSKARAPRLARVSKTLGQFVLTWLLASAGASAAEAPRPVVRIENHQPFSIRMPFSIHGLQLGEGSWMLDGRPIQQLGTNAIFIADTAAQSHQELPLKPGTIPRTEAFRLLPDSAGVSLTYAGKDLGKLSWDILLKPVRTNARVENEPVAHEDFDAAFAPMNLAFRKAADGPVFEVWEAQATKAGLKLEVQLLAYGDGFLDINARLTNESADESVKVYAAVVCRWEQQGARERSLCYDNRIAPLAGHGASPFRAGEGRHQFTQRGVDWVRTDFNGAMGVAWLNGFAPSFTLRDDSSRNTFKQPRYEGANLPQLGQEVQTAGQRLYSITEIARDTIRSYRDRLAENALPARGDGPSFCSRLVFSRRPLKDAEVDRMFVGFTSYNEQRVSPGGGCSVSFGVPTVRFGTSYFPYSTLGENFDRLKLPGMDREAFWPLAADTVLRWRNFADDIRRDLRIAKAMGFELIRLHHLELLASIPERARQEYLDFLFGELRHLRFRALVDLYASDAALEELLKRYGDLVDGVELENEILIWGIPLDRPAQWKQSYETVKRAHPKIPVHLTGYNNTGMFDRLAALGVPFDRVGLHSYVDSLDAIPTARGYALALGSYCSRVGKPPIITEWNWRQLTRMSPEARAKVYPAIFENVLSTRAIPDLYQFQFNETLAPNPRSGRGNVLRHYELLNLSRRPKLEALELAELIKKYSTRENSPLAVLRTVIQLDAQGKGEAQIRINNPTRKALKFAVLIETPAELEVASSELGSVTLGAGASKSVKLHVKTATRSPGFYHCFLRFEGAGFLQYAWVEARLAGPPQLDLTADPEVAYPKGASAELKLDFTRPLAVVYGSKGTVLEVETAFAIAGTLESACGQPIEAIQEDALPGLVPIPATVIVVGTSRSNPLIAAVAISQEKPTVTQVKNSRGQTMLLVTGGNAASVERAGMDLLLHWWKQAKDSAARRVGLAEKVLPRGGDASKLP